MQLDEIRESFAFFDSWEDRYRFVIDIGRDLPELPREYRVAENIVRGCQSQVWLMTELRDGRLRLTIDSDAHIVRGLIVIVLAAYQGKTPADVGAFDIEALFDELDLFRHLSPTRGNGLRSMVARIRHEADQAAD
ncbi:MAG: SufE family protein [Gammaproteobacteria bacterium]|nr:SufE family protein [Gammaproteobacteria bacterium]MDE0367139.1 SufE family protein [Gammaproteobacteria bacterium]